MTARRKRTIPLNLDGYTDLPPGKIANVVTYLQRPPPARPAAEAPAFPIRRVERPTLDWYRDLYRRIGEDWLWFSATAMLDDDLAAILHSPSTRILALEKAGRATGLAELSFATPGEVEIVMFGVVPEATGTGAAHELMRTALAEAAQPGIGRIWLHTCTFDHPAAVRFYLGHGFRAFKYAIEVSDDPRLGGRLPVTAAPHVPVIPPSSRENES